MDTKRIKVISWIIGSGLLVWGINIWYTDFYNQPDISIKIRVDDRGNSTSNAKVIVENNGREPARNILLHLNPQSDIIDYKPEFQPEEFSLELRGPRALVAKIPRLADGTGISIDTLINSTKANTTYWVFATYDQGSTKGIYYPGKETVEIITVFAYGALAVLIFVVATACLSFAFPAIFKRIKQKPQDSADYINNIEARLFYPSEVSYKKKERDAKKNNPRYKLILNTKTKKAYFIGDDIWNLILQNKIRWHSEDEQDLESWAKKNGYELIKNDAKLQDILEPVDNKKSELAIFVADIKEEITAVRNALQNNIMSRDILSSRVWDSKDLQTKQRFIDHHDDFRWINDFYTRLKVRNDDLLGSPIDDNILKRHNDECLRLAQNALKDIDWTKYFTI